MFGRNEASGGEVIVSRELRCLTEETVGDTGAITDKRETSIVICGGIFVLQFD